MDEPMPHDELIEDAEQKLAAIRRAVSKALAKLEQRVANLEAMHEEGQRVERAS
jgi:hypothetical protein